ncbi:hypothetical protein ALI144C_36710 [Actinosynnema sp. ALI-1.44]|nr:hypothetical protein ALI144C_36710 [Actinosynnema sp. ALI-1.44]
MVDLGPASSGPAFHPTVDWLRTRRPVCQGVLPDGSVVWLVTRYEDVRAALADPRLSLSKRHAKGWKGFGLPPELDANLLNMDAPDHTRIRRLVAPAFRPHAIERLRPRVERITEELVAALRPLRETELVGSFIEPLTLRSVCELLGVPLDDQMDLRRWNTEMLSETEGAPEARDNIVRLMRRLIRRRRTEPGDDLISRLVVARDQDGVLSEDELTSLIFLVMVAGYMSSANFIGLAVLSLCGDSAQLAALRSGAAPIGPAVSELLRYDTPEAVAPRRFPVVDMDIGGVRIRAGEPVVLVISSANRDPRRFPDAQRLVLDRAATNLSFGHGPHYCLGAALARLQAETGIAALVRSLPGLRLAQPDAELVWLPSFRFRGLCELPVTWDTVA